LAGLLIRARQQTAATSLIWLAVLFALSVIFLRRELRAQAPVLQLRLFRNRTFAAGNLAIAFSNLAMYTTLLAVPVMEGEVADLKPIQIGFLLASMSATNLIAAPLGGRLSDRYGRRWPAVAG